MKNINIICLIVFFSSTLVNAQELESAISKISNNQLSSLQNMYTKNPYSSSDEEDYEANKAETLKDAKNSSSRESIKNLNDSSIKFGYDFFNKKPSTLVAVGDLPFPNDYKISLKDKFTVILSGSTEEIFDLSVKLDGTILFPRIGSISVIGETFKEVKNKINNIVDQSFIGVDVDISLSRLSAKKITIVGAVKNPGTYIVNPFSSISSALIYSGGVLETGSLRNIKLIKNDGGVHDFDLYELLVNGDRSNDITIDAGDTLMVEGAYRFVELSGSINRPLTYELKEGEKLDDIVRFGLGFKQTSNKNKISISNLDLKNASINQIETDNLKMSLDNAVAVKIFDYSSELKEGILVKGAVKEAGYYKVNDYPNLETLINSLVFVNTYPFLGILEQFDKENLTRKTIFFNLFDPFSYRDVTLTSNSKVYFIKLDDFENFSLKFPYDYSSLEEELEIGDIEKDTFKEIDKSKLEVDDNFIENYDFNERTFNSMKDYELTINHDGNSILVPIYGQFSVESIINILGLDVSDIPDYEVTYISPLENIVEVGDYRPMKFKANKFHNLSFKSPQNSLISVSIEGAIEFPGNYTLSENSSLQDLYNLVGNFKNYANYNAILLQRESVKALQLKSLERAKADLKSALFTAMQQSDDGDNSTIDTIKALDSLNTDYDEDSLGRIAGVFIPDSIQSRETILQDGDSIYIPNKSNTISVIGEVMNPNAFIFNTSISYSDAISLAGGFKQFADKRGGYIIKENGLIYKPGLNIFRSDKSLDPGDTIVVPREVIMKNTTLDVVNSLTAVLSQIAFSAAALESLQNN